MARTEKLAEATMGQMKPEGPQDGQDEAPKAEQTAKDAPKGRRTPPRKQPAPRKAATPKAEPEPPQTELGRLAADPVAFIEAMPAVKRGALRRALNSDLPGDLGEKFVEWCRIHEVSQRDVLRALVQALVTDSADK